MIEDILLERVLTNTFTLGFELEGISNENLTNGNLINTKIYKLFNSIFGEGGSWKDDCSIDINPINMDVEKGEEGYLAGSCGSGSLYQTDWDDSESSSRYYDNPDDFEGPIFTSFEYNSPVLKFTPENLKKIYEVFDKGLGKLFYTNDSCGFHHHLSFEGLDTKDAIWIICQLALDDDARNMFSSFNALLGDSKRTFGFISSWSEEEYLNDIKRNILDGNIQGAVKILESIDKYSILNPHVNNTLEWRGPRDFLNSNNIQIVKQFYKHLWKIVNWMSKAQDKKELNGMSKENFFKMIGDISDKPLANYGNLKLNKDKVLDWRTLEKLVERVKNEPNMLLTLVKQNKRVCDQIIQSLFLNNSLGKKISMLDKGSNWQSVIDIAYKYIPLKLASEASSDAIYNTSIKTIERMFKGLNNTGKERYELLGYVLPKINPETVRQFYEGGTLSNAMILDINNIKLCWDYLWDNAFDSTQKGLFILEVSKLGDDRTLIEIINKAVDEGMDIKPLMSLIGNKVYQQPKLIKYIDELDEFMLLYLIGRGYKNGNIKEIEQALLDTKKVSKETIKELEQYFINPHKSHGLDSFDNI